MEISDSLDAIQSVESPWEIEAAEGEEGAAEGAQIIDADPADWAEASDIMAAQSEAQAQLDRLREPQPILAPQRAPGPMPAADADSKAAKPPRTIWVDPWTAGASSIASRLAAAGGSLPAPKNPLAGAPFKGREKKAWTPIGDLSKLMGVKPEDPVQTAGAEWALRLGRGQWQGLGKALSHMPELAQWSNARGWTLAHWAAWNGPKQALRLLQKAGVDWEGGHRGGETPLIVACRRGRVEAVETLLEFGADAKKTGLFGQSAIELLSHAFAEGNKGHVSDLVRVVSALRDRGSSIALPVASTLVGREKALPSRGLAARVLGDGVGRDMGDLAEALIEMGERPSEEDLDWAHRRGSSEGVSRARAALERALLQEETHTRAAESHRPRILGEDSGEPHGPRKAAKRI